MEYVTRVVPSPRGSIVTVPAVEVTLEGAPFKQSHSEESGSERIYSEYFVDDPLYNPCFSSRSNNVNHLETA